MNGQVAKPREAEQRRGSTRLNRLFAAIILGLLLVLLSGLLSTAIGAWRGTAASPLWATSTVSIIAALLVAFAVPTARMAWAALCFFDGWGCTAVLVARSLLPAPEQGFVEAGAGEAGFAQPLEGALRVALFSAGLSIAAVVLALGLLTASYFLFKSGPGPRHQS